MLPNVEKTLQILPGWKPVHALRGCLAEIPEKNLIPIGVKAKRKFTTMLFLNVVAVLLGLLASQFRVFGGFLGFDDGQCLAIPA